MDSVSLLLQLPIKLAMLSMRRASAFAHCARQLQSISDPNSDKYLHVERDDIDK